MKNHHFPQVLLLGNGLNRAYGGDSWDLLLEKMKRNSRIPKGTRLKLPMPLQAVLLTDDQVDVTLNDVHGSLYGELASKEHCRRLSDLLEMGADHILTTNYSYELELAGLRQNCLSDAELKKILRHTDAVKRAEGKYLLHTYNEVRLGGTEHKIWHIHGEARKPQSMILGHYGYAALLQRLCNHFVAQSNRYQKEQQAGVPCHITSWADAFLLGDVYVLGFGFDVSEIDLWWLLNRKKREKADTGAVHYFSPAFQATGGLDEKCELLRVLGVKLHDCGVTVPSGGTKEERGEAFRRFYPLAIGEIRSMIQSEA